MYKLHTFMLTGIMFAASSTHAVAQDKLIFSLQWIANGNNFGVFADKKMEMINLSPSAKYASLVAKTVDSIVGFVNEEPAIQSAAQKTGLEVGKFVFSDYGIDYYSLGIIASDDIIAKRPDLVRRV